MIHEAWFLIKAIIKTRLDFLAKGFDVFEPITRCRIFLDFASVLDRPTVVLIMLYAFAAWRYSTSTDV